MIGWLRRLFRSKDVQWLIDHRADIEAAIEAIVKLGEDVSK